MVERVSVMPNKTRNVHNNNYRTIQRLRSGENAHKPETQKKIYDEFRAMTNKGVNDDIEFIDYICSVADEFINPDLTIMAYTHACLKATNNTAFQERMMNNWAANIDKEEDLYQRLKLTATAADMADVNTFTTSRFSILATQKWEENINQIENLKHRINQCNAAIDENKTDAHFAAKVRQVKRKAKAALNANEISSQQRHHERQQAELAAAAEYFGYSTEIPTPKI